MGYAVIMELHCREKAKNATGTKAAAGVTVAGSRGKLIMMMMMILMSLPLGTASSQSALTTVTAIDYDDMSDLDSDLEITQLT